VWGEVNVSVKISIIIPLYNKESTICPTLDSVFSQTESEFEVIVVDDGSTDSGPLLVRAITDQRLRYYSQKNAGPGAARNYGASLANGKYLSFLDADDQLEAKFIETHLKWLSEAPDCQMSVCGLTEGPDHLNNHAYFNEIGITSGEWDVTNESSPMNSIWRLAGWICCSGAIVCQKEAFDKIAGFYDKNRCLYGEDHSLWLVFLLNYKIYINSTPLMWVNTEASSLGVALQGNNPPRPILTDPSWIFARVPHTHIQMVQKLRSRYAVLQARQCVNNWQYKNAIHFLNIAMFRGDYLCGVAREWSRMVYKFAFAAKSTGKSI
jgi:hypothetical protein